MSDLRIGNLLAKELTQKFGTPLYVYDKSIIEKNYREIVNKVLYEPKEIHFSIMSNGNVKILMVMKELGMNLHASSVEEVYLGLKATFDPTEIIVTGSNFSEDELRYFVEKGIFVNLNSVPQIEKYGMLNYGSEIGIRITCDLPLPEAIINAAVGSSSRSGISPSEISDIQTVVDKYKLKVTCLHSYIGTNIMQPEYIIEAISQLVNTAAVFPFVCYINVGGGFGIDYEDGSHKFDWKLFGKQVSDKMNGLSKRKERPVVLKIECGRAIVATAGILLTKIIDIKYKNGNMFLGVDTNLSNFARPYIYNAFHKIVPATNVKNRKIQNKVFIGGNSVTSQDFLGKERKMPILEEGEIIAILDVGAYGFSMSSNFCGKLRPAEILIDGEEAILIRKRETTEDLLRNQIF